MGRVFFSRNAVWGGNCFCGEGKYEKHPQNKQNLVLFRGGKATDNGYMPRFPPQIHQAMKLDYLRCRWLPWQLSATWMSIVMAFVRLSCALSYWSLCMYSRPSATW